MKLKLLFLFFFMSVVTFAQVTSDEINDPKVQISEFDISPNPAKSELNISLSNADSDLTLEVFDVLGKRVYKGIISKLEYSVNISNWKSGVYLVRVFNDKTSQTKRFIKQ